MKTKYEKVSKQFGSYLDDVMESEWLGITFISTLDHDPAGPLSLQPECRQAGAEPQLDGADQRADSGEADQLGELRIFI